MSDSYITILSMHSIMQRKTKMADQVVLIAKTDFVLVSPRKSILHVSNIVILKYMYLYINKINLAP